MHFSMSSPKSARVTVTAVRGMVTLARSRDIALFLTTAVHLQMYIINERKLFEVNSSR